MNPKTVEQIVDEVVEIPKVQIVENIVQRTVEQIVEIPKPQIVKKIW